MISHFSETSFSFYIEQFGFYPVGKIIDSMELNAFLSILNKLQCVKVL